MSIWKNNIFIHVEETPDENKSPQEKNKQPDKGGSGTSSFARRLPSLPGNDTSSTTQYTPAAPTSIRPDMAKFTAHFDGVLGEAKIPEPNYFTFSRMLAEMGELPDAPKFKGAFAALKVQGLSKASLIATATSYLHILDQDNAGFKQAVENELKENSKKIQDVKATIQANLSEIDRIKKETDDAIRALEQKRDSQVKQLQDNNQHSQDQVAPLEESSRTVNEKVMAYDDACSQYKSIIQGDINKIESIIS